MPGNIYAKANRQLQRAIARGDLGAAIHWTNIMRDHIGIARTFTDLAGAKPTPKPRRAKSKAETQAPQTPAPPNASQGRAPGPGHARPERVLARRHAQLVSESAAARTRWPAA